MCGQCFSGPKRDMLGTLVPANKSFDEWTNRFKNHRGSKRYECSNDYDNDVSMRFADEGFPARLYEVVVANVASLPTLIPAYPEFTPSRRNIHIITNRSDVFPGAPFRFSASPELDIFGAIDLRQVERPFYRFTEKSASLCSGEFVRPHVVVWRASQSMK